MIQAIETKSDASNQAVIEYLEEQLEKAKAGDILSIGVCAVLRGGMIYDGWCGGVDTATLLGASNLLQTRLINSFQVG